MLIFLHFLFLLAINNRSKGYAELSLCSKSKIVNGIIQNEEANEKIRREYNCRVMDIGVVQRIPYDDNQDHISVTFPSACVRCALCLAIADKINQSLLMPHDGAWCGRYLGSVEAEVRMEKFCADSFLGYRLREVRGKRYIGDNLPGSVIVKSTGDGLWTKKLTEKCEEILGSIEREYFLKYLRDRCKTRNGDLRDSLCHGKLGASRDCRGILNP